MWVVGRSIQYLANNRFSISTSFGYVYYIYCHVTCDSEIYPLIYLIYLMSLTLDKDINDYRLNQINGFIHKFLF